MSNEYSAACEICLMTHFFGDLIEVNDAVETEDGLFANTRYLCRTCWIARKKALRVPSRSTLLCVVPLYGGFCTLKRFVPARFQNIGRNWQRAARHTLPEYNPQYKSLPHMPVFPTVEDAQDYRDVLTNGTMFLDDSQRCFFVVQDTPVSQDDPRELQYLADSMTPAFGDSVAYVEHLARLAGVSADTDEAEYWNTIACEHDDFMGYND